MTPGHLQQQLFQQIKERIPAHHSLADEVAEVLQISIDSAYRRIRGEKPVSIDELNVLARHFRLSLDKIMALDSDGFIFTGQLKPADGDAFASYLENLQKNFTYFNSFENRHLYLLIKDLPPFIHFQVPELALFKFYLWMKSILHDARFRGVKFSFNEPLLQPYLPQSEKIADLFNDVPMTEIWNIESVNTMLRQINFYYEAGIFKHEEDVKTLYEHILKMLDHIERQAEYGLKFRIGTQPDASSKSYRLFVNELILGDNTYLAELNGGIVTFLNHSVLYYISTRDENFNKSMLENLTNLMNKSTLISGTGEKDRIRFFNRLRDKIQARITALK